LHGLNYALQFAHVQTFFNFFLRKNPMTLEQIRAALADRNITAVAKATGINAHTLYRILRGTTDPHAATLRVLGDYLGGGCVKPE
jgi:DNA-binding phage protein